MMIKKEKEKDWLYTRRTARTHTQFRLAILQPESNQTKAKRLFLFPIVQALSARVRGRECLKKEREKKTKPWA